MGAQWSQFFPPKPAFTEADVPSQDGKVFLITGGYSGIGFELAKMLYRKKGRVYIAGRSEDKALQAIQDIHQAVPGGGSLEFLHLELDDLTSIKASIETFKAKESKLDVLWNNAGVSQPPVGSVSKQGIELQIATNCLGPFLFTQMILPLLQAASGNDSGSAHSARVIWTCSQMAELSAPPQGIIMEELRSPPRDRTRNYTNSKTANMFLASELARREGATRSIISVSLNPGAASTDLFRHTPWMKYLAWPLLYTAREAAHTVLFAGLSGEISMEMNGCYIVPWGRVAKSVREDLIDAMKLERDGGSGRAKEVWDFCEEKTRDYF